jgi:DNA polymerase-1
MSKYVFDIEADDLLLSCERMWVLVTYNLATGEIKHYLDGDLSWMEVFNKAKLVVGHNILGYDVFVLKKLFNYEFPKTCNMHDTLLMSQILDYRRFGKEGHSLERWGRALGNHKIDFHDFSKYSEEMLTYCKQDVLLNVAVYNKLLEELKELKKARPNLATYLKSEHYVARWATEAQLKGWPFDVEAAINLMKNLQDEKDRIHALLYDILGIKSVIVDRIPNIPPDAPEGTVRAVTKSPKWKKNGEYDSHTCRWFGVNPEDGLDNRPIWGDFSRVEFKHLELTSVSDVKLFLERNGWEPTEWNWKFDEVSKTKIKGSPKITEDSLELLGGNGRLYADFLTINSRFNILKTWIENVDSNGNLHGDSMIIGTPSMRTRHQIIVNVPSADSPYGKEMRKLFSAKPGWVLVGADSAGNQARGLAHYINNEEFTDTILNGDIHTYNANALTTALKSMKIDYEVPRSAAKRVLYAFLFGASGGKLWSYIFGIQDEKQGNKLKQRFTEAVPGFEKLLERLKEIYGSTSKEEKGGYIPSLAGNKIYVDSWHKLLVYLLQSAEKITCSAATMLTMEELEKENIEYQPLIMYHDEIDFMVKEEDAEKAAKIAAESFKLGPKLYGVEIMDGDAKIGKNWYEIH